MKTMSIYIFCHFSFAIDWERCSPKERPRHHPAESNRGPSSVESVRAPNWHDTYEPQRVCTSVNHVRSVGRMGRYTCAWAASVLYGTKRVGSGHPLKCFRWGVAFKQSCQRKVWSRHVTGNNGLFFRVYLNFNSQCFSKISMKLLRNYLVPFIFPKNVLYVEHCYRVLRFARNWIWPY